MDVADEVKKDLERRIEEGVDEYGQRLQAGNDREALQDLYEELLDAACYTKQKLLELDHDL